ncbi:MAG: DUF4148 domain-containing protein [Paraburkholderia sp.]|nr:DUF4148 domain-containing protein [Burkholderia sp. 4M9327F10]
MITRHLLSCSIATLAIGVTAVAHAATNAPLTRAEVRADLVSVEHAGYVPSRGNDINYPGDIQAAEAKIAAHDAHDAKNTWAAQGYGGMPENGRSAAGVPRISRPVTGSSCVGPASFCSVYFGS